MAACDCDDVEMVKQTLVENLYDVQASINYILLLQATSDDHSMARQEETVWEDIPPEEPLEEEEDAYNYEPVDYSHYKKQTKFEDDGKRKKKTNDPKMILANRVVELEGKKSLSNKERQELNRLRKEATNKGVDLDEYRSMQNSARHNGKKGNQNHTMKVEADDEDEITALMETAKDFGAMKI